MLFVPVLDERHAARALPLLQHAGEARDALIDTERSIGAAHASHLLVESGHWSVWEKAGTAAAGRIAWREHAGAATPHDLPEEEFARLRVLVAAPIAGVMAFTGTASVPNPGDLLAAMAATFSARGGQIARRSLTVDQPEKLASQVVVAAGVASAALLAPYGHRAPMIAERGYHLHQPGTG